jgi:alanine racemase
MPTSTCTTTTRMETEPAILEIDLRAIGMNYTYLRSRHAGAVAAVVKADAYGLGATRVAPYLHAQGCRHFFTANLAAALRIRPELPDGMVAVLNTMLPGSEGAYLEAGIDPVLGSLDEVARWRAQAARLGRRLPALLHVDTGLNRLGLDAADLAALQADHRLLDGIALRYVMTHLVSAELPDDPANAAQRAAFAAACAGLPAAPRSLANSSGIFLGADFASDLARPGAALYGINPVPGRPNPLRQVVRLRARVLSVRAVPAGATVGYNGTWAAARPSRIATVAVGYADGWHRSLSGRGHALFDGAPVPLVGRISMDLTTYDATDHPGIVPGAWLELIGAGRTADDIAADAGTNGYEVLTSLGRRYARRYIG